MSVKAISWAFEQRLDPVSKIVLLALADHADDDGNTYPSVGRLAEKCCIAPRTVHYHLRGLEQEGFLRSEPRPGRPTRYVLALKGSAKSAGVGVQNVQRGMHQGAEGYAPGCIRTVTNHQEPLSLSAVPEDFWPDERTRADAKRAGKPDPADPDRVAHFIDKMRSMGRTSYDWQAEYRAWMRRERQQPQGQSNERAHPRRRRSSAEVFAEGTAGAFADSD